MEMDDGSSAVGAGTPAPAGGTPAPNAGASPAPGTAGTGGTASGIAGTDMPGMTGTDGMADMMGMTGSGDSDTMGGDGDTVGTGVAGSGGAGSEGTGGAMAPAPQTCATGLTLASGETTETVQVGAMSRRFILHVPASYTGDTPVPLVIDWHGILMNSNLQRAWSGFAELSERENFIVAYPEGTDTAFNVGICCTSSSAVDDVAFAHAIIDHVSERGCVDHKRIHSVGYSMGGGMSMHLACHAADRFASVAASAFDMMPEADWPCSPSRPIPIILFRSTGDPIVPYAGAVNTIPPNGTPALVTFIGAKENLAKWAGLNGCTDAAASLGGGCELHSACGDGVEVELCTKQGGGHDYMDASVAWEFLKRHPLP
jgi:polyhydroxybutyrate depolymerase